MAEILCSATQRRHRTLKPGGGARTRPHSPLPSYHAVPGRGGRGQRGDGDGRAQALDHGRDAVGHVGGVVALVLPAV